MKEQIEEMALIMCGREGCKTCTHFIDATKCAAVVSAKKLYNAGYRKQKEGEWIKATEWMRDDGEIYDYRCSACNMLAEDGGYGNRDNLTNFCPNCGAKMKGGAE
jgi:hypothetical protein